MGRKIGALESVSFIDSFESFWKGLSGTTEEVFKKISLTVKNTGTFERYCWCELAARTQAS